MHKGLARSIVCVSLLTAACATVPPPPPEPPVVTWEDKLGWMMRLEDQRIIRDPNPPPPVVIAPATPNRPAIVAPAPPSDLIRLLNDSEARVRRRAAMALGRVGLPEAVDPLVLRLTDEEPEVRLMAAFALGQLGDPAARPALLMALTDLDPRVQGRAAEALGMIADEQDADAVSGMVRTHAAAGALAGLDPDDLTYPQAPAVEAVRLGLYALVRLNAFEPLAAAALDANGRPVSRWWPIAYALQRQGDPRAADALLDLVKTPGRFTAAFAARGLGVTRSTAAAPTLRQIVQQPGVHLAVVIQSIRALAAIGDADAVPVLTAIVVDSEADVTLRIEAMTALGGLASQESLDLMLDLLADPAPAIRGTAMRALARIDPLTFLGALSGLDPDRDWTVRLAQAAALGMLPPEEGLSRLRIMLDDPDPRVVPGVLAALVGSRAPDAEQLLVERLGAADFATRSAAAAGLAELKAVGAVPELIAAYREGIGDSTYDARAAALVGVAQINPAVAEPILREALNDREWAVRVRVAQLLRSLGADGTVAEAIRPAVSGRPIDEAEWAWLLNPPFSPHAYIETDRGTIEIELAVLDAPQTVANFAALARKGFFNGIAIHRVVPDFVVQDGDPRGDGTGGPGYAIRDEINERPYLRGTVGMALDWEDTGGSQFFITHSPQPHLDGRYTVFGHVVNGMEVVDSIEPWDVIRQVRVWDGITTGP